MKPLASNIISLRCLNSSSIYLQYILATHSRRCTLELCQPIINTALLKLNSSLYCLVSAHFFSPSQDNHSLSFGRSLDHFIFLPIYPPPLDFTSTFKSEPRFSQIGHSDIIALAVFSSYICSLCADEASPKTVAPS